MAKHKIRQEDLEDIEEFDDPHIRHLLSRFEIASEFDSEY